MQNAIASRQPISFTPGVKTRANLSDYEMLVQRSVLGDNDAFLELLPKITKDVLYSTRYILRNQMDAEDAAQEIMVRVCTGIKSLRDPGKFKPWLNSIVFNETRRFMKDFYKTDPGVSLDERLNDIEEKNVDNLPYESAEKDERDKTILKVIHNLPKNQRLAILFHYYQGLSVTETAGMMGVKQQSVSRSLKLAKEKIKNELSHNSIGGASFAGGFAMIPLGVQIKSAMLAEAELVAAEHAGWVAHTVQACAPLYGSANAAAAGTAAAGTAGKLGLAIKPILAAVAAVTASAAVAVGVYTHYNETTQHQAQTTTVVQAAETDLDCEIVFTGGSENAEHVNPMFASVTVADSELAPQSWWITPAGSEEVIFSGEGSAVDSVFGQMAESGMDGSFTLNFSMLDSVGGTYVIYRDFAISK